jgi:hypothetical protein
MLTALRLSNLVLLALAIGAMVVWGVQERSIVGPLYLLLPFSLIALSQYLVKTADGTRVILMTQILVLAAVAYVYSSGNPFLGIPFFLLFPVLVLIVLGVALHLARRDEP